MGECLSGANVQCAACTPCTEGTFETQPCTATSDRIFGVCDRCEDGEYALTACVTDRAAEFVSCTAQCAAGTFLTAECSELADIECTPCACEACVEGRCAVDSFVAAACTATADLQCEACAVCGDGTYEASACTTTADTECLPCSTCGSDEYVATPCGGDPREDTVCAPCTSECPFDTYMVAPCSTDADTLCEPCVSCNPGTYRIKNCTAIDGGACAALTACASIEFESVPPTSTSDRQCTTLTECGDGEFISVAATPTSNRQCSTITAPCPDGYTETQAPSRFQDRVCTFDGQCTTRGLFDLMLLLDASGSIGLEHFERLKTFATRLVAAQEFPVTRVAVMQFHNIPEEVIAFSADGATVISAINAIAYPIDENRATATAQTFTYVSETLLDESKGHRSGDTAVVIFTDGPPGEGSEALQDSVRPLHDAGLQIIVAALSDAVPYADALAMASDPENIQALPFPVLDSAGATAEFNAIYFACPVGTFEESPCAVDDDRMCLPCTACTDNEYQTRKCRGTVDASCAACRNCTAGEYETAPCSPLTDRQCAALSTCTADQYISVPASAGADLECSNLTSCKVEMEFELNPPTASMDRTCAPLTPCLAGQYESSSPTGASDRVCSDCSPECTADQFETRACSSDHDRICTSCSLGCPALHYELSPCNSTSNRICAPVTKCDAELEYQVAAATATSDTVCTGLRVCDCDLCPSTTQDPCPAGNPSCSGKCTYGTSLEGFALNCPLSYEGADVNATVCYCDESCREFGDCCFDYEDVCSQSCGGTEYESVAPTPFSDRKCAPLTPCGDGQTEVKLPTCKTDRECAFDGVCSLRNAFDVIFLLDASGSIGAENFQLMLAFVTDFVGRLDPNVNVGITLFHNTAEVVRPLYGASSTVADDLTAIVYPDDNRGTATVAGVTSAIGELVAGNSQPDNAFVVAITDGRAAEGVDQLRAATRALKSLSFVIAMGIGTDADQTELRLIATRPDDIYLVTSYEVLSSLANQIIEDYVGCDLGFYETSKCTADADRVCSPCRTMCPSTQYITGACVSKSDRECVDCREPCGPGEFEFSPCDGINDRVCLPCSGDCGAGLYRIECTATSDRVCEPCTAECPTEQYRVTECGGDSDHTCTSCREQCVPGFYETVPCSTESDRQCKQCSATCPEGQYESVPCSSFADRECAPCSGACPAGEYEAIQCGALLPSGVFTDRQCLPCTVCAEELFEIKACTPTQNRQCRSCQEQCIPGKYAFEQCTPTSDRDCRDCLQECLEGSFESSPCTPEQDRECATCRGSCDAVTEFESKPCDPAIDGAGSDRECALCDECSAGTYEISPCNGVNNRVCKLCGEQCIPGFFLEVPCTSTSNRVCTPCSETCPRGTRLGDACTPESDLQCLPCSDCEPGFYGVAGCDGELDQECAACTLCVDGEFASVPCSTAGDAECRQCRPECEDGFYQASDCTELADRVCLPCPMLFGHGHRVSTPVARVHR